MKIIGLAGTFSSGKDTLAKILNSQFKLIHISTSDIVRELSFQKFNSTDRPYLQKISNEYREKFGNDYFAIEAYRRYLKLDPLNQGSGLVISGMRSVGEARKIKELGGTLVFIDAPIEIRYARAKERGRDSEVASFEDFKASEAKEWEANYSSESKHNLKGIKELSDIQLDNSNDLESFINEMKSKLKIKNL
jgi:dephospho-CoA kinase